MDYRRVGANGPCEMNEGLVADAGTRALVSFKTMVSRFRAECAAIEPQHGKMSKEDIDHLARWENDPRAELIWQKIQRFTWGPIGSYDPLDSFIPCVLLARRMAETASMLDVIKRKYAARAADRRKLADAAERLAKFWRKETIGDHPLAKIAVKRMRFFEQEANAQRKLSERVPGAPPFHVSRLDRNGSRLQRVFMQVVGQRLIDLCRRPMDVEVAALNDIAFDTSEATSPYQARSARRPTTNQGRRKRSGGKAKSNQ